MGTAKERRAVITVEGLIIPGDSEMRPGDYTWWRGKVYVIERVLPEEVRARDSIEVQDVLEFEIPAGSRNDSPTRRSK